MVKFRQILSHCSYAKSPKLIFNLVFRTSNEQETKRLIFFYKFLNFKIL